jgi:hypothetical protein
MDFSMELSKEDNMSRILVKIMSNMYETGEVPAGRKTSMLLMIYKGKQPIITINHIEDIQGNIGEVIE